jgi:hypothetical protein
LESQDSLWGGAKPNMRGAAKIFPPFSGFVMAATIAGAQAPGPTVFDGQYAGVSAHVSKARFEARCPHEAAPEALSITNGVINSGGAYRWTGSVNTEGHVVIRNRYSMRVNGHIDQQGIITGQHHGPTCIVTYVWRKQSG